MKTRKYFMVAALLSLAMTAHAQGNNTRNGGPDGDYESLAERVAKIEKKRMLSMSILTMLPVHRSMTSRVIRATNGEQLLRINRLD